MLIDSEKNQYIEELDGLRAFAVLAVFAYHLGLNGFDGGFLGVDIFFVISGYLITSKILISFENDDFSFKEFWLGRIRRLIPAAYIMIVVTFIWVTISNGRIVIDTLWNVVASIFYFNNWWFIFNKLSYFDSFALVSPYKNLWSLAIEEQFYILFPIIMIVGLKVLKQRKRFAMIILIGALASAILMGVLYKPGMDPSRVYYGTDTRAFELLIGSLLALICPMKKALSKENLISKKKNIIGIISFILLALSVIFLNEYQTFIYIGGMLVICINTAIVINCISHKNNYLKRLFCLKQLKWIGKRSYGIYLWHYPIIVLSTPAYEVGHIPYWFMAMQLIVTFIIAGFSYRFIEKPIRKYGFRKFFRNLGFSNEFNKRKSILTTITSVVSVVIVAFFIGYVYNTRTISINTKEEINIIGKAQSKILASNTIEANSRNINIDNAYKNDKLNVTDTSLGVSSNISLDKGKELPLPPKPKAYNAIFSIGDSIMIDIEPRLAEMYHNITIDGKVGRQLYQVIEPQEVYKTFNNPNSAVIVELGTNGYFTDEQLDGFLSNFSNADIYLVNVRVPRQWEDEVNRVIERKVNANRSITLIDWYSAAISKQQYFAPDGVHLEAEGVSALTALIQKALEKKS